MVKGHPDGAFTHLRGYLLGWSIGVHPLSEWPFDKPGTIDTPNAVIARIWIRFAAAAGPPHSRP
jgi:hypothetical protein